MIDSVVSVATPYTSDSKANLATTTAWELANKRADTYLRLHNVSAEAREQLIAQCMQKLMQLPPCSEQELIERCLNLVREELSVRKIDQTVVASSERYESALDSRIQTGPRLERTSIRVAPLQSLTLRLLRSRPYIH